MQLNIFETEEDFIKTSLQLIVDLAKAKDGDLYFALSGGSTPVSLYQAMAKSNLPFERIELFEVDERYVPRDHPDSNCNLIYQNLVSQVQLKNFTPFDTKKPIKEALEEYEKLLPINGLDLTILGIGPDGHTASLFPHSSALDIQIKYTSHSQTDHFAVKDRLTLTFPAILNSKHLLVLLKGKDKQHIIKELQNPTKSFQEFPAIKLLEHPKLTVNFLNQ